MHIDGKRVHMRKGIIDGGREEFCSKVSLHGEVKDTNLKRLLYFNPHNLNASFKV